MNLRMETREIRPSVVEITLDGRLDSTTSPDFERVLLHVLDTGPSVLHLDLAELRNISSAGLGLLIIGIKRMRELGRELSISNMQPPVKKVLEIAAALPEMSVFESAKEADRYFDLIQRRERGEEVDE